MGKIVVLGSTGMLGSAVGKYFLNMFGADNVYLSYRNSEFAYGTNNFEFKLPLQGYHDFHKIPPNTEYVINCIGIIKPFVEQVGIVDTIYINSMFPHALAQYCNDHDIKLIHITTDCVFSGENGSYGEGDVHDAMDVYGRTKSLGEPINKSMVLRTSIIGEEIHNYASLVEWAKSQKGRQVPGFENHLWNGVTTKTYAKICHQIMAQNLYRRGLFHVFSPLSTDKYRLLCLLNERFDLHLDIVPQAASKLIDRRLRTERSICHKLIIPTIEEQIIKEM